MTSISIDFWYQLIIIGGLNRLISIILIDFWYWYLLINYIWKDVRLWGCKLWGCEVVRLRGFKAVRLTGCDFALWSCDVWSCEVGRLSGCETVRLWYETMRLWYDILSRLWGFEPLGGRGGGVAFSLIPSFTFPSFKNSQITLDNLAWSAIGRDLTSQREKGVKVKGKMFIRRERTSVK